MTKSNPLWLYSGSEGLDLIDRVPDELWMEVSEIVQETGIKTITMEKKCKNPKWLSEEGLQIAVKRREVKNKGEKERYPHLNAEFQRIARREKKVFLSDQWKEIEENNRMGKTRDLFKKIKDIKGKFLAKTGKIKDRNGMGLTEAVQETQVRSLSREDPLEKEKATHPSILAWRIPWREEPGRLQSMGSTSLSLSLSL